MLYDSCKVLSNIKDGGESFTLMACHSLRLTIFVFLYCHCSYLSDYNCKDTKFCTIIVHFFENFALQQCILGRFPRRGISSFLIDFVEYFVFPHSSFLIDFVESSISSFCIPHSSFLIPHSSFRIDFVEYFVFPHSSFRIDFVESSISSFCIQHSSFPNPLIHKILPIF